MTRVSAYSPHQPANGLFAINLTTLTVFWLWGLMTPRLARANLSADRLMLWGLPLSIASLMLIASLGAQAGWWAFTLFFALTSVISLSQPALGLTVPTHQAGRIMTAFNLLLFAGAFFWQWGIGLMIDLLKWQSWSEPAAFRAVFALIAACHLFGYAWFAYGTLRHQRREASQPSAE